MTSYNVSEIFYNIQGEGPQLGMPAVFIRLAGCNLGVKVCPWCDSQYAFQGAKIPLELIIETVNKFNTKNVIITGGEPFVQDIKSLIMALILQDKIIYVETNGTEFDEELIGLAEYIVSPKLNHFFEKFSESQIKTNQTYQRELHRWAIHATFKIVIGNENDFNLAKRLIQLIKPTKPIYFMPETVENEDMKNKLLWLIDKVKETGTDVRITPRLHIYLWGLKRGV